MKFQRLNILHLCDRQLFTADSLKDHMDAFSQHSAHRVYRLSRRGDLPQSIDLNRFDVILIHFSLSVLKSRYLSEQAKERIARFQGLKVQFVQDEYRQVNQLIAQMQRLGIDVLFTCVPEAEIEKVYPMQSLPHVRKVNCLTGYVSQRFLRQHAPQIKGRPIDVGYRSRKMPLWMGRLGVEKWQIADEFSHRTRHAGLNCNFSYQESERLYGKDWIGFLGACKAILGVESGASVFDFTGELQTQIEDYVRENPGATYSDVYPKFLQPHEDKIQLAQISPRCFEAACLKTAMVLFEGEYSGVLEPGRHYFALKKDFSNVTEAVNFLKDEARVQEMVDRVHTEIAQNPQYSYAHFIKVFDDVVSEEFFKRHKTPVKMGYDGLDWGILRFRYVFCYRLGLAWRVVKRLWRRKKLSLLAPFINEGV